MLARFKRAMKYWLLAVSHPGDVLGLVQRDLHRVRISFYIILVFSLLYSFTAFFLWHTGRIPTFGTWIPGISQGDYYYYQALWTLPWMLLVWLSSAGFIYLFTSLAGKEAFYEDALFIAALSLTLPYLMFWWIPETFLLPAMGQGNFIKWPELFEFERKYAFPGLWQLLFVAYGMRKVNNTNRVMCLLAGLMTVLVLFFLYLPFMR